MIALVLATEREAHPLISLLAATEVSDTPFPTWRSAAAGHCGDVLLRVSGVGKVAAAAATASLLAAEKIHWLINLGACGVLVDSDLLTPGTLCQVRQAVEGDRLGMGDRAATPVECHPIDGEGLVTVNLVTTDQPVFDADRRRRLAVLGQVVDMEGAAVARTAAWFGVPCLLVKGITDAAGPDDRDRLRANLAPVIETLAQKVPVLLQHPSSPARGRAEGSGDVCAQTGRSPIS
ncbi:MAG: hypothetical protein QNJ22_01750 [Desulfosarcinaceae bacterium]|nr:hypothetical protein [Desulfosarcinaceae bacterium]